MLLCVLAGAFDWTSTEPGERMFRSRTRTSRQTVRQYHLVLDSIHEDIATIVQADRPSGSNDTNAIDGAAVLTVGDPDASGGLLLRVSREFEVAASVPFVRPPGRAPPQVSSFLPTTV